MRESNMQYTTDSSHCPRCGHTYLSRRKRSLWMRLVRIDKHYRCEACRSRVLYREPKSKN
jgi:DNA-directed RNA polymerase subunit RPC12/RpoP